MKKNISRYQDTKAIRRYMKLFPITALLGPRQCGKTFLARQINYDHYFDLENPRDFTSLENPQLELEELEGVIIIDEIQRKPDLYSMLRYLADYRPKQKYLILGSASPDLIKKSSETLAGRVGYYALGGLGLQDVGEKNQQRLWLRGGFPRSFLASREADGSLWLNNYIATFLERDIPQLGISIPAHSMRKFWVMLSHYHGQIVNYSELGRSLGISDMTTRKYLDILKGTFMIRLLQPWSNNTGKRLVKQPKVYIRDSGIYHALLSIEKFSQLKLHPKLGASWEGFALECLARAIGKRDEELYFWSTHTGAEVDLFWQENGKNYAVEFKFSDAPKITKSMQQALQDLELAHLWVAYPGKLSYPLAKKITVEPLKDLLGKAAPAVRK